MAPHYTGRNQEVAQNIARRPWIKDHATSREVPKSVHDEIHKSVKYESHKGGDYNYRFFEEIEKRAGDISQVSLKQLLNIRDALVKEFKLTPYDKFTPNK